MKKKAKKGHLLSRVVMTFWVGFGDSKKRDETLSGGFLWAVDDSVRITETRPSSTREALIVLNTER